MLEHFLELLVTIIIAFVASSGFWFFLDKKLDRRSFQTDLLIGLAHDRLVYLGLSYIKRGSITKDEYENLEKYLYGPYRKLGGNGSVDRIMVEVNKLPIKEINYTKRRKPNVVE